MPDRKNKITDTFNEFSGKNLQILDSFYSKHIEFSDPVKTIHGLVQLKEYYREVYKQVESIQFHFHRFVENENVIACEWTMSLTVKGLNFGKPYTVKGSSFFEFDQENLVQYHRDYLDLGEMVYEKIPIFGKTIKLIKAKL